MSQPLGNQMAHLAGAGQLACDWLLLTAMLPLFGLAVFALWVAPPASDGCRLLVRRLWAALRFMALAQLLFLCLVLLARVSAMAGVGFGGAVGLASRVVRQTHFGRIWLGQAALALAAGAVVLSGGFGRRRSFMLGLLGAGELSLWAASGHGADSGWVGVGVYFVHEAAAGLWFSSLMGLWLAGELAVDAFGQIAVRVSRLAGWCVGFLMLSGLFTAYNGLGPDVTHLFFSRYGRILLVKVAIFVMVLAIGGHNRVRLIPVGGEVGRRRALMRNVAAESVLLLGVLALAALLANTPPARMRR